jgi:hypothetical protein
MFNFGWGLTYSCIYSDTNDLTTVISRDLFSYILLFFLDQSTQLSDQESILEYALVWK